MSIRASASARDITPKQGQVPLMGFPGALRHSTGVRDPLMASAVHLRGGSGGIILVSLDLFHLGPTYVRRIRDGIEKATGTPIENIFIGATRCHSAPPADDALYWFTDPCFSAPDAAYMDFVVGEAVHAAAESAATSRPASVATVASEAAHTGTVLVREDASGRIIAIVAVHRDVPDYLGPANTELSADLLGAARKRLAARFGGEPILAYYPSATGASSLTTGAEVTGRKDTDAAGVAFAESIVAQVRSLSGQDFSSDISFNGKQVSVTNLPRRGIGIRERAALVEASDERHASVAFIEKRGILGFMAAEKQGHLQPVLDAYEPAYLQLLRIGDQQLLGVPGTLHTDCLAEILGVGETAKNAWVSECINGDLQGGILTGPMGSAQGCQLHSGIFLPEAGLALVAGVRRLFSETKRVRIKPGIAR